MTRYLMRPAVVALFTALAALPATAQQTFRACYVPTVGAMYLLDLPGLPTACLSQEHEEISWTEGGATPDIEDGAVTGPKLAEDAVTGEKIADGAVGANHVQDSVVDGRHVARDAIGSEHLERWAVDSDELAPSSVYELAMRTGSVATFALKSQAVTTDKIAIGAVAGARLGLGWTVVEEVGIVPAEGQALTAVLCPTGLEPISSGWQIDWGLHMNMVRLDETRVTFRVTNPSDAPLDYFLYAYCADIR